MWTTAESFGSLLTASSASFRTEIAELLRFIMPAELLSPISRCEIMKI